MIGHYEDRGSTRYHIFPDAMPTSEDLLAVIALNAPAQPRAMKLKTHDETKCSGQHCCIHSPSDHHMKDWPMIWRDDKGVMERICPHGVGHPDPDCAAHLRRTGRDLLTVHGCDGCCMPPAQATT